MVKCSECLLLTVSAEVIDGQLEDYDSCARDNKPVDTSKERECKHFVPLPDKDPRLWFE